MSKSAFVATLVSLLLLGVVAVSAQDPTVEPEAIDVESATRDPVPIASPDDDLRRVFVAEIEVVTDGELPVGELLSTDEFASYAPKVFVRAGGPWVVQLDSNPEREFFILDPRYAEAEREDGEGLTWVRRAEPVLLRLVIPLYDGDERIEFGTATVIDLVTGAEVITIER